MKRILCLVICGFLLTALTNAQTSGTTCPAPKENYIYSLCGYVESGEPDESDNLDISFKFENVLWEMSCVNKTDSLIVVKSKVKTMWDNYKETLICRNLEKDGDVVPLVVHGIQASFPPIAYEFIEKYDIDLTDRIGGENVFEHLDRRLKELKALRGFESRIMTLEGIKRNLEKLDKEQKQKKKDEQNK